MPSTIGADARAAGLEGGNDIGRSYYFLESGWMDWDGWVGNTYYVRDKTWGMYTMDASVWISINAGSVYHHLLSVC